MKKIFSLLVTILICLLAFSGCGNISKPDTSSEQIVIRYPTFAETDTSDYEEYYKAKLDYPGYSVSIDNTNDETFELKGKKYSAKYSETCSYTDADSDFLKAKAYDVYAVDEIMELQVFKDTGYTKGLFVLRAGLQSSPVYFTSSEKENLIHAAEAVLHDIYGDEIDKYLGDYYRLEDANYMEYTNKELNRYIISYRAYLNETPTDDVIYVQFAPEGSFLALSAKNYLQYLNFDTSPLLSVEELNEKISQYLDGLSYEKINERSSKSSKYYTLNTNGELYYATEWEVYKVYDAETGAGETDVEILAVKAN